VLVERHLGGTNVKKIFLVLAFGLMTAGLRAAPILDFEVSQFLGENEGSITLENGAWIGRNIEIDSISLVGTAQREGPLANIFLNFNTGTGAITVTGAVPVAGITDPQTVLLSGTISDWDVANQPGQKTMLLTFRDIKEEKLVEYFAFPQPVDAGGGELLYPYFGNLNLSFTKDFVLSGDLTNYPVPEPFTLLLMGAGLVGLGLVRRKRA
jgi:hypothetical protein